MNRIGELIRSSNRIKPRTKIVTSTLRPRLKRVCKCGGEFETYNPARVTCGSTALHARRMTFIAGRRTICENCTRVFHRPRGSDAIMCGESCRNASRAVRRIARKIAAHQTENAEWKSALTKHAKQMGAKP